MMKKHSLFLTFFFFTFFAGAQVNQEQISHSLASFKVQYKLTEQDIDNYRITDQYTSPRHGITHVYLRQTVNGTEVFNANSAMHFDRNGKLIRFHNGFVANAATLVNVVSPSLDAHQATLKVTGELGMKVNTSLGKQIDQAREYVVADKQASSREIRTKLYYVYKDKQLKLVWNVSVYDDRTGDWWNKRIDAVNGASVEENNWTIKCDPHITGMAVGNQHQPAAPAHNELDKTGNTGTYRVFALPLESPSKGARSVVANAATPEASPFGWHDVNGIAGADYTITRGNNVFAHEDTSASNDDAGHAPDGGSSLVFDYPFDSGMTRMQYLDAAITNLFYWNNIVHDIYFNYGFDEEAGNFQQKNYSGKGAEEDFVQADAQDGSGTANANFSTPPDGSNPRMQMFMWPVSTNKHVLYVNAPNSVKGRYLSAMAGFGPILPPPGITGELAIAEDISSNPTWSCGDITTDVNGKIAVIDRGDCFFVNKVLNAQAAGAIAAIIVNNDASEPFSMGGSGGLEKTITIPSLMMSKSAGDSLRTLLESGTHINVTLVDSSGGPIWFDSDFDNGVIIHESAHGVSNRLTGGPSNTNCLTNAEQAGEGWSDFFALALTAKATDDPVLGRGMGTYLFGQDTNARGLRQFRYSRSMAVNPATYKDIKIYSEVHGVGFVWCTMLYDIFADLVDTLGFDNDIYKGKGGNNMAIQLVMDGLKLQPCNPGFVDSRDAILLADSINNKGAFHQLLWKAFARRGLGFSADQFSSFDVQDGLEAFDLPPVIPLPNTGIAQVLKQDDIHLQPNPFNGLLQISSGYDLAVRSITVFDLTGKVMRNESGIPAGKEISINLQSLPPGMYVLNIQTSNGSVNKKIIKE